MSPPRGCTSLRATYPLVPGNVTSRKRGPPAINDIVDHHAAVLEATAQGDNWTLRFRFARESLFSEFQTYFRESDYRFELGRLLHPSEPRQREFGLTADQHDALTAAANREYLSVPRDVSLEELGESLGISANAVSQRLRRGCDTLVRTDET